MKKLLSVTLFSGLLTLLRMASGFVIGKAVAVSTGPGGLAMIGQLQSFVTAITGVVTAPAGNGLVRYTAEHHGQGFDACAPWWRASLTWVAAMLALTMPISIFAAHPLSVWLFGDGRYAELIVVAGLVLPLSALNTLVASVINGQQQYKRYIVLGMISVIVATAVMLVLIRSRNLQGALLAAATFTAISGCVMACGAARAPWFRLTYWVGRPRSEELSGVRSYMIMTICSALCAAISLIFTRNILIDQVGISIAGNWQAVYKISEVYLGVITMALATYFFPRLSAAGSISAVRTEIAATAKVIVPLAALAAFVVYLLRDFAISVLFTDEFRFARNLFGLQLAADVVKVASWLLAYAMLARKATLWFVCTEVFFSFSFPLLVYVFVRHLGVHGANVAYLLNYLLYLGFLMLFSDKYLK